MVGAGMKRSKVQEEEGEKCSLWARNDGEDRERDEAKANDGVLKEDAKSEKKEESVSEHKKKEEREEVVEGVAFVRVREQWNSSMFNCLGGVDNEFLSSDLEVCLLGAFAPCMLYASNVERMRSGGYLGSCTSYALICLLGYSICGSNCLAPCITHPSRTNIRRQFNLEEGSVLVFISVG
ncbi:cell number regulator 8-like isoform X2 [Amborella trichopoda]|uniref:cell number regulator 8-like isoform X2 n=1 Tax=Amborella trichopoda TaxID=13333 RepID=UPI0005D326D6|nr:cell number regulator 8-like isoform X2 [Amborella trichopoda]|eukprot:XP_011624497.1 cell number regulator 8-like isoform X2 [Amborella trichopoda]